MASCFVRVCGCWLLAAGLISHTAARAASRRADSGATPVMKEQRAGRTGGFKKKEEAGGGAAVNNDPYWDPAEPRPSETLDPQKIHFAA